MTRLLFICLIVSLSSCRTESTDKADQPAITKPEKIVELPEDFKEFYELFHSDSLFQLNHIAFPLSGKPASGDFAMELTDYKWLREGWKIHKAFDEDDDTFDREFTIYTKDLISEKIYSPTFGYHMERRFGKLSDGWNLIYYADMQERKERVE